MRAPKDLFEGVGDEADADVLETFDTGRREVGWDDEDLQDACQSAFLAVREMSAATGLLTDMKAADWVTLCDSFTPSAHLHDEACTQNRRRAQQGVWQGVWQGNL